MINLLEKSNYPIFVFEGPDGAGKTMLANALTAHIGGRYMHLTHRWNDKKDLYNYAAVRVAAHLSQKQPVIIDRWWPSEVVYADVYRGGSKVTKSFLLLEHIANKMGVVYVVCLPKDRERYIEHYSRLKESRLEMYDNGLDKVYDGYADMYKNYLMLKENVCHYDIFKNYDENEVSRGLTLKNICQNVLEMSEDHRSTL